MEQSGSPVKRSYDGEQCGTPYRGDVATTETPAAGQWSAEEWGNAQWVAQWNASGRDWTEQENINWRSWYASYDDEQQQVPTVPPMSPTGEEMVPTVPPQSPTGTAWLQSAAERLDDDDVAAKQREDFRRATREQDAAETAPVRNAPGVLAAAQGIATRAKANPRGRGRSSRTPTPPKSPHLDTLPEEAEEVETSEADDAEQPRAKGRRRSEAEAPTTPSDAPQIEDPWSASEAGSVRQQPRGQAWSTYDDEL